MADLWLFLRSVLHHWRAGVTGGVIAVASLVSGVFHPMPRHIVAAALAGYFVLAAFYAWRDERRKSQGP